MRFDYSLWVYAFAFQIHEFNFWGKVHFKENLLTQQPYLATISGIQDLFLFTWMGKCQTHIYLTYILHIIIKRAVCKIVTKTGTAITFKLL